MAEDLDIRNRISSLIAEEHELRQAVSSGAIEPDAEQSRLSQVEIELDQCWDLLRQRRAKREFGESPEGAAVRPADTVEGYLS